MNNISQRLNKYQKSNFTSSAVVFLSKINFLFFKFLYKYTGYPNLWDFQLRITFFGKGMWQKIVGKVPALLSL